MASYHEIFSALDEDKSGEMEADGEQIQHRSAEAVVATAVALIAEAVAVPEEEAEAASVKVFAIAPPTPAISCHFYYTVQSVWFIYSRLVRRIIFNRPGVAKVVLETGWQLIQRLIQISFSLNICNTLSVPNHKSSRALLRTWKRAMQTLLCTWSGDKVAGTK